MHPGLQLHEELANGALVEPFLGVYDCFSATIASRFSRNIFLSGFGLAASAYGLPDVGYIAWSDMVQTAWRIRQILPAHRLLVDIDDGYVDLHTACLVARQMDAMGTAMIMLEDQARPRRCGHAEGKILLPLQAYLEKLQAVLDVRESVRVLARTDASGEDIFRRVEAISRTDADVLLVDGIDSVETLSRVVRSTDKPLLFNQIAGGKSPLLSLDRLRALGVRVTQYSTPLLFAAQRAMGEALDDLFQSGGLLTYDPDAGDIGVVRCTALLEANVPAIRAPPSSLPSGKPRSVEARAAAGSEASSPWPPCR